VSFLDDLIAKVTGVDGDLALIRRVIDGTMLEDPLRGRMLRLCALVRTIDQDVVNALWRALDGSREGADPPALSDLLGRVSFAREKEPGQWSFHDRAQQAIISDLDAEPELKLRGCRALYELYTQRATEQRELRHAVTRCRAVLALGDRARLASIDNRVDGLSIAASVDAMHVALQLSRETGMVVFFEQLDSNISSGDKVAVEGLIRSAESLLSQSASEGSERPPELVVAQASLAMMEGDPERASKLARNVAEDSSVPDDVRDRAYSTLQDGLQELGRNEDRLEAAKAHLALRPPTAEDLRLPARAMIVLSMVNLGQYRQALSLISEALEIPERTASDRTFRVMFHGVASVILTESAQPTEALQHFAEAYHGWRTLSETTPDMHEFLPTIAASVARGQPAEQVDPILAEARISFARRRMTSRAANLSDLLDIMMSSGRRSAAVHLLDQVAVQPSVGAPSDRLAFSASSVAMAAQLWSVAEQHLDDFIDRPSGSSSPVRLSQALARRADARLHQGDTPGAEDDIRRALATLTSVREAETELFVHATVAKVLARLGRLAEAETELAAAQTTEHDVLESQALLLDAAAVVMQANGDLEVALTRRVEAAEAWELGNRLHDAADAFLKASSTASLMLDQRRSADLASRASDLARRLASVDPPFQQSEEMDEAAHLAADIFSGSPPKESTVYELQACAEGLGRPWWVQASLAYALVAVGRNHEAGRTFEDLIEVLGGAKRCPAFVRARLLAGMVEVRRQLDVDDGSGALKALVPLLQPAEHQSVSADLDEELALLRIRSLISDHQLDKALVTVDATSDPMVGDLAAERLLLGGIAAVAAGRVDGQRLLTAATELASEQLGHPAFWPIVKLASQWTPGSYRAAIIDALAQLHRDHVQGGHMTRSNLDISVDVPDGWQLKQSITVFAPDGLANVIASTEPLAPEFTTETYAGAQGDLLDREFPQFEQLELSQIQTDDEREFIRRVFRWTPEGGEQVTQIQLYCATRGRGYTATATTPTSEYNAHSFELELILRGLIYEED
jgi:tetratricopeptide (TPR) repeat protein